MYFKPAEAFVTTVCFGTDSTGEAGREFTHPVQTLHFSANIWYPIFRLVYFVCGKLSFWQGAFETDFTGTKMHLIWPTGQERCIIPPKDNSAELGG